MHRTGFCADISAGLFLHLLPLVDSELLSGHDQFRVCVPVPTVMPDALSTMLNEWMDVRMSE